MLLLLNGMQAHMAMHAKSILSTWGAHGCYKRRDKAHYQSYKLYLTRCIGFIAYSTTLSFRRRQCQIPKTFVQDPNTNYFGNNVTSDVFIFGYILQSELVFLS